MTDPTPEEVERQRETEEDAYNPKTYPHTGYTKDMVKEELKRREEEERKK